MIEKYAQKIKINDSYLDMIDRTFKFILINLNSDINNYEIIINKEKLDALENKRFDNTEKIIDKAPFTIKEFKPAWLYYTIYTEFNLHDIKNIKNVNSKKISSILQISIEFHKKFNEHFEDIIKKSKNQSVNKTGSTNPDITSCLRVETQFIVRLIEYLIFFSRNDGISEFYFSELKTTRELIQQFQNMISNEYMHKNYFYMSSSYLLYLKSRNSLEKYDKQEIKEEIEKISKSKSSNIFYLISSSRKCTKSENFIENFISDSFKYQDFIHYGINSPKINKNNKTNNSHINISYNKERNFRMRSNKLKDSDEIQNKIERNTDRTSRPTESVKSALQESTSKIIGNSKSQFNTSISASANNLKEKSYFESYYSTPYIIELKDFFQNITVDSNSKKEKLLALFIFSLITGSDIIQTIDIINGDDKFKKSDGEKITVKLDEEIFAKYNKNNTFFDESNFTIEYQLPPLLKEIYKYIQNNIEDYNKYKDYHYNKLNKFNIYKTVKLELFDTYKKEININIKQIWKINLTHQLKLFKNIYTAMFIVGRYNKTDEAKITYASTRTTNISYSIAQLKYIEVLDLNNCCKKIFDFKMNSKIEYHILENISGSFLSIKYDDITKFVNIMLNIIKNETDPKKRFNFISLYVRFCLTFLNGTRFYIKSSNIHNLSLENAIQIVNEKAETNLAGIRLIGLSSTSVSIIKKYITELNLMKQLDDISDIYFNNFVKIKNINNKYETYNIKNAKYVCQLLPYNEKRIFLEDFIESVPTNTGRHLMTKLFIEKDLDQVFLETFLGHYIKGAEHTGIYSTLSIEEYHKLITNMSENIAKSTGIRLWE